MQMFSADNGYILLFTYNLWRYQKCFDKELTVF